MIKTQMPSRTSGFDSPVEGGVGNPVSSSLSAGLRQNTAPALLEEPLWQQLLGRLDYKEASVVVSNPGQRNFPSTAFWEL